MGVRVRVDLYVVTDGQLLEYRVSVRVSGWDRVFDRQKQFVVRV